MIIYGVIGEGASPSELPFPLVGVGAVIVMPRLDGEDVCAGVLPSCKAISWHMPGQ